MAADEPPGEIRPVAIRESIDPEDRIQIVERSTSSRSARREALQNLPLARLTRRQRQQADEILRDISLYRRLPTLEFPTASEVYRYFVAHPDVAVSIWRAMEISTFEMTEILPGRYQARDSDGTTGSVDVLYHADDEALVVCDGVYRGALLRSGIRARVLFHSTCRFAKAADGSTSVQTGLEMFVSFPSLTVETAARIVSPLSNMFMDRNFREIGYFAHMMSTAMQQQPGWVEHIARQLDGIPETRRAEFLNLTARVYVEARKRQYAHAADGERRG